MRARRHQRRRNDRRTDRRHDAYARDRADVSNGWRAEYRAQGAPLPDGQTADDGGDPS